MHKYLKHSLFKSTLIYTLSDGVNKGVVFLILPILSYYLLPSDYGILSNFNILLAISTILITVGVDSAISVNFYKVSKKELSTYISNGLLLVFYSFIICVTIVLIFNEYIYMWTKVPFNYQILVLIISVTSVFTAINLAIWRLEGNALNYGVYEISQMLMNITVSFFFIIYFRYGWEGRVFGILAASIFFALVSFIYLKKNGYLIIKYDKIYFKEALLFSLPLIPHSLSFWIRSGIDRIYITGFIGEAETGLYATGFQFGILISFFTLAFNNSFVPYLYKLLSEPNKLTLIKNKLKIVKLTYLIIFLLIFLSIFFGIFSNFIIQYFFNFKYYGAKEFIYWAILSQVFQGFYLLFVNYLFFIKKTKTLALITFSCSLIQIVLSYILIKSYGAIGGAYATCIVSFINFFIVFIVVNKIYSMPWFKLRAFNKFPVY